MYVFRTEHKTDIKIILL